ncbi:glycosyltransferase [Paenibacillus thailandensis]|uniref:Glycosyltransferase n=1 Tax=Paenibacillus thailandensis TaxID=393250 RepID=A0ABW5QTK0_9BACL
MNIWLLTSEFPPEYGGGIGMYVNQAAQMFAKANHQVTVIVRDHKKSQVESPLPNLRIIRFKHMQGEHYNFMGYWAALAYQFANEVINQIKIDGVKPDVIEVQDYNAIGYYLLMKKWQLEPILANIPIVVHLHTPTFELDRVNQAPMYKFPNYWIGQMEKFCLKAADALISPSQYLKDQLQRYVPEKEIQVINLPYYIDDYSEGYKRDYNSKTLLYFGRTEYRKGVSQMLQGAEQLWANGEEFTLKIIGGDTYFHPKARNLGEILKEKYAHRIKQNKLVFCNAVPPEKLNPEILAARAVIVPSLYENYPYTCLSAMWLGSPMLVSRSGGQAEMVQDDELAGLLFDWNISGDFEKQLARIVNLDSTQLEKMSKVSHNRIREMCNITDNLKQRVDFFEKVIDKLKNDGSNQSFPTLIQEYKIAVGEDIGQEYEKGLLSIVIPYYNLGEYLAETIQSALATNYTPIEIVIVNDGTNDDNSIKVLDQYRNHSKIRIIDIQNRGLANARNVGAINSKGEYIAFLDADDLIEPEFYPKAINILNQYKNVSYVYSWLKYFGNSHDVWPTFNTEFPYFLASNMLAAFVVVRKSDFINYGQNKIAMEYGMEDYEGWVAMASNGCIGVSIPEPLVHYRVRSNSMSRQFNRDVIIYLRQRLSEFNSSLYQKYGLELFNLIDANGPGYLWDNPTLDYPPVSLAYNEQSSIGSQKQELMRLANSKWGSRIIKLFFKLKMNKLLR